MYFCFFYSSRDKKKQKTYFLWFNWLIADMDNSINLSLLCCRLPFRVCSCVSLTCCTFMPGQWLFFWERRKEFQCDEHSVTPSFFFFSSFCRCLLLSNERRRETRGQKKRDVALSEACLTQTADNLSPSFTHFYNSERWEWRWWCARTCFVELLPG